MRKILWCFIGIIFCISCSDSPPAILAIKEELIAPNRLSVFVQPSIAMDRLDSMHIIHEESSLQWEVSLELGSFVASEENSGSVWFGSAYLKPPYNEPFPSGVYTVIYTDVAGRQAVGEFFIKSKK